jgi:hypothetical protein
MMIPNNSHKINLNHPHMQFIRQTMDQQPLISDKILSYPPNSDNTLKCDKQIQIDIPHCSKNDMYDMFDKQIMLLHEINNKLNLSLTKNKRNKNTYFSVTKTDFNNIIKLQYPDFPDDKISMIYTDASPLNEIYYIEINKKKFVLNKKNYLRFLNKIV